MPFEAKVRIEVYNSIGQMIEILVDDTKGPGYHNIRWNAGNMSSGVYLYRILAVSTDGKGQFTEMKRMILIK